MKIEIKEKDDQNVLFVDGELFDWGMEPESIKEAKKFCQENPTLKKSIHGDIQNHFVESFSEFIGRPITLKEVVKILDSEKSNE